jgi:thiol-disulfide isomerase/thioredoxin
MKQLVFGFLLFWTSFPAWAQSPFVLTGLKSYTPVVAIEAGKVDKKIKSMILEEMETTSKELGIDTKSDTSLAFAFDIKRISIGETVALKVDLMVSENLQHPKTKEHLFVLLYIDTHIFVPEDLEEELMDAVDEMLTKFASQYEEDNSKALQSKSLSAEESFAVQMQYETDYKTALEKAKKEHKLLMVFMSTNYCPWCRKLENRVLSRGDIDKDIKAQFVPLMLNFSEKNFPSQLNDIAITPILYIIDPLSEKIQNTFVGYNNHEAFLQLLGKK